MQNSCFENKIRVTQEHEEVEAIGKRVGLVGAAAEASLAFYVYSLMNNDMIIRVLWSQQLL